jgi:amino acid adenylation domain-containing protein
MAARALHQIFLDSVDRYPQRPALEVDESSYDYAQLCERAKRIAATLVASRGAEGPSLTCVLGQRSRDGFAGILGALLSGHGYVPILPTIPVARISVMLERSEARALIVDGGGIRELPDVLEAAAHPLTVLVLGGELDAALKDRFSRHTLLTEEDLVSADAWRAPSVSEDDIAYLLFTSGSTGQPKGVMVAHRNVARFLDVVVERYSLIAKDRFSHMFEVTFDLSVFDMFATWQVGGCLCCPNMRQRMLPASYVVDANISVWFSVPSTALLMKETRTLVADAFPDLRISLFCGEALPVSVAEAWVEAAPRSLVENIYGPTELTLACTAYEVGPKLGEQALNDVVPIGEPFPQMRFKLVDEQLQQVAAGESGELIMAGPQLTLGYWRDAEKTAAAFVVPPGESETFYRTGDRVSQPTPDGPLVFLGRLDSQIKIRGYRVELGEIEAVLRREANVDAAVALGWPLAASGGAEGVVAFIDDDSVDTSAVIRQMGDRLPRYMLPREIRVVSEFPLNPNGKIDRKALRAMLQ